MLGWKQIDYVFVYYNRHTYFVDNMVVQLGTGKSRKKTARYPKQGSKKRKKKGLSIIIRQNVWLSIREMTQYASYELKMSKSIK